MKRIALIIMLLVPVFAGTADAQVTFDGFVQGLFGGRLDSENPTNTDYTANETRLQLRTEHYGDGAEVFGRLDFVWDGADSSKYELELREAYLKFRLGSNLDFKIGRQILTWGPVFVIFFLLGFDFWAWGRTPRLAAGLPLWVWYYVGLGLLLSACFKVFLSRRSMGTLNSAPKLGGLRDQA